MEEELIISHSYPCTPFKVEIFNVSQKGFRGHSKIKIYKNDEFFGEYIKNYHCYQVETFCPFKIDSEWYALYSCDYTASRVAKLETHFEDWCGEEGTSNGFCPTEFFVPIKATYHFRSEFDSQKKYSVSVWSDSKQKSLESFYENYKQKDSFFSWASFALLSGCVWGDDNRWKLRYINLSEIPNKILKVESKFGYWPLPNLKLFEAITMSSEEDIELVGVFDMDMKSDLPSNLFADDFFDSDWSNQK